MTYNVGDRVRTLQGANAGSHSPAGSLGTVTSTEYSNTGTEYPISVLFDGDEPGEDWSMGEHEIELIRSENDWWNIDPTGLGVDSTELSKPLAALGLEFRIQVRRIV